ncbi:MAG: hypothetical protein QW366_03950 [Sulfolobales archaeon]
MSSEEFNKRINDIFEKAEKRLKEIYDNVERKLEVGPWRDVLRFWRHEIRSLVRDLRRSLEEVRDDIERANLSREEVEKIGVYMRDRVEAFIDRMNEIIDDLESKLEEKRVFPHHMWMGLRRIPDIVIASIGTTIRSLDKMIRDLSEEIAKVASTPIKTYETEVVSSVRVRSEDLKIIDQLVEGGVFKSRSEAVSYFTRRGLECSREWIEKALEQIKRIKEIQDSIKRELEKEKDNGEKLK